jgi:hypothetical protein
MTRLEEYLSFWPLTKLNLNVVRYELFLKKKYYTSY